MTHEELEGYISRLLPSLRRRFIRTADEADASQMVLLQLFRNINKLNIHDDTEFVSTFVSYLNRRCRFDRVDRYRKRETLVTSTPNNLKFEGIAGTFNPWTGNRVEAIEYIELITDNFTREVMFKYYILGFTLAELRTEHSISEATLFRLLQKGVEEIKLSMSL